MNKHNLFYEIIVLSITFIFQKGKVLHYVIVTFAIAEHAQLCN